MFVKKNSNFRCSAAQSKIFFSAIFNRDEPHKIKAIKNRNKFVSNCKFETTVVFGPHLLIFNGYSDLQYSIVALEFDKYLVMFLANLLLKENHVLKNREMHVQQIIKTTKSSEKITKNSEKITKSSEKILRLIKVNTQITIKQLAQEMGLSTRSIEKNIAKLKLEKRLERIGGDKGGFWKTMG
jgi:hypothetical protein